MRNRACIGTKKKMNAKKNGVVLCSPISVFRWFTTKSSLREYFPLPLLAHLVFVIRHHGHSQPRSSWSLLCVVILCEHGCKSMAACIPVIGLTPVASSFLSFTSCSNAANCTTRRLPPSIFCRVVAVSCTLNEWW